MNCSPPRQRAASDLIVIGAVAARVGVANSAVHSAVSAAIAQLSRTPRVEYARRGLRVRSIEPGYMRSCSSLSSSRSDGRGLHPP